MDGKDRVIKHLEIIQGVINRLANNSFLVKGWSMTILAAAILFIAKSNGTYSSYLTLSFAVPMIGFWVLDGYFIWQERLFRGIYNDVRMQENTDFEMNVSTQLNKPKHSWLSAIFSLTLNIFYIMEFVFIILVFIVLRCK